MLETLTPEQEKLIPVIRDKWLKRYFSLEFDEKKARELVNYVYSLSKKKKVSIMVMDSPMGIQIALNKMEENIRENIRENIKENISENISESIWKNINENIWKNIRDNISENIKDNINENIWKNISENIWKNI